VKELLKPFWHEGRLSKDAHVLIVKKSVDKVVSTLEPQQIPTTEDNAKHYVSSCRPKIAKLVQVSVLFCTVTVIESTHRLCCLNVACPPFDRIYFYLQGYVNKYSKS
jgi:hypothetical protein